MYQVYLITYSHSRGTGRTCNYRQDGLPPSIENIESIERKIADRNCISGVCVTGVFRLADRDFIPEGGEHRD